MDSCCEEDRTQGILVAEKPGDRILETRSGCHADQAAMKVMM